MMKLAERIQPCGPVIDARAAERAYEALAHGQAAVTGAWTALAPIFAASPYLSGLARRDPARLNSILSCDPDRRLADILARTAAAAELDYEGAKAALRGVKGELHLLTALADLGGVWDLDAVTGALTRFADASLVAALQVAAA